MKGFIPASEEELIEINGRGGSSPASSSDSGSDPEPSPAPSSPPEPQAYSSLEKGRIDAAITAKQLENANTLIEAKASYGGPNTVGETIPTNLKSYDCSATMSATTGNPYQTTAALMDPQVQAANGYEKAVSNKQAGTWTVVQYKDPDSGNIVGHAQMTMGDGKYFDSVPGGTGATSRSGPSTTKTSTLDYLKSEKVQPLSVVYLRPKE